MKFFDAIYVINLASRKDRKVEMLQQLRQATIDDSFAPVIFHEAFRPTETAGFPSIGARGCFMSHLGVLKRAQAAGSRRILLLEDDANFDRNFQQRFGEAQPLLEAGGYGFSYLGWLTIHPGFEGSSPVCDLPIDRAVIGAHMLAIDSSVFGELIACLEAILGRAPGDPAGGPMHVDGAYNAFRRSHPTVKTAICMPPLGYQRPSRTDIAVLRWFDRMPLIRNVVSAIRRTRAR